MAVIWESQELKPRRTERRGDPVLAIRLGLALATLMSSTPGCGFFSSRHPAPASSEVVVEVENHNWSDITIYLMAGGLPHRLGMVSALSSASFAFPSQRLHAASGVRLRALPVAGQPFTSDPILVQPGQAITWTLENDLDRSSFTVY
jgi:hypothetical protein